MKKSSALFIAAIAVAIVTVILGVYYLIPHVYHPFIYPDHPFILINHPLVNYNAHKKYTAFFFGIALTALLGAFLARPKKVAAVNS